MPALEPRALRLRHRLSGVGSPSSSEEAYCPGFGVDVFGYGGEEGGGRGEEEEEEEEDTAGSGNGYDVVAATPQNCKTWTSRPRRTTSRRQEGGGYDEEGGGGGGVGEEDADGIDDVQCMCGLWRHERVCSCVVVEKKSV